MSQAKQWRLFKLYWCLSLSLLNGRVIMDVVQNAIVTSRGVNKWYHIQHHCLSN